MIFKLKPVGKDYIWGGIRLKNEYGKNIPLSPLAETWECSVHPDGESIISDGIFAGQTLGNVLGKYPKFCGNKNPDGLPLLVKLIDAADNLSVQVHPDNNYALMHENQNGKTEMWYVLDADENACLIYGFEKNFTKQEVRQSLSDGSITDKLKKVKVRKGDVFFIPAGTVHAIGKGVLVAEIQQNSNLTYRIYDYDRRDKDGNLRPLHIQKALDVMNLSPAPEYIPCDDKITAADYCIETICKCEYFNVKKLNLKNMFSLESDTKSFKILLCTDGKGTVSENDNIIDFRKGDCIFYAAYSKIAEIKGNAEILIISS
ncbi:MAG: class I mannose-6-phosphate isomerase [Ruminococcus sp.]|nr:class I mannose-6-phosphate isomerase [Ruminococcus sp.]